MALNITGIVPASLKAKEDYVDTYVANSGSEGVLYQFNARVFSLRYEPTVATVNERLEGFGY